MKYFIVICFSFIIFGCQPQSVASNPTEHFEIAMDSNLSKDILTHLELEAREHDVYNLSTNHKILRYLLTQDSTVLQQVQDDLHQSRMAMEGEGRTRKILDFIEEKTVDEYAQNIQNGYVIRLNYWEAFTWNGTPVITIVQSDSGTIYRRKRYTMDEQCSPFFGDKPMTQDCFTILEDFQDSLNNEEFFALKSLLHATSLYTMASNYEKEKYKCMDGDWFKIEVLQKDRGRIIDKFAVERNCAGHKSPLKIVGNYMIGLRESRRQ